MTGNGAAALTPGRSPSADHGFFAAPRPIVVGHRGDPSRHPDNSLAGVMAGLAAVGAVEIDVRMTSDGTLLLSHDPVLADLEIASTPWEAFAALPSAVRPIQLDDVLALPGRLDLEVKNLPGEPGFDPGGRLALVVASRMRPGDILTSFYWPDVDRVRERSGVATGLLVGEGGSLVDAVAHAADHGHVAVFAHDTLVEEAIGAGEPHLAVWTVDDVHRARELSGMGVAAIISDDPRTLNRALRE